MSLFKDVSMQTKATWILSELTGHCCSIAQRKWRSCSPLENIKTNLDGDVKDDGMGKNHWETIFLHTFEVLIGSGVSMSPFNASLTSVPVGKNTSEMFLGQICVTSAVMSTSPGQGPSRSTSPVGSQSISSLESVHVSGPSDVSLPSLHVNHHLSY